MALGEYEAKRQRRIEANQQKLRALNVPKITQRAHSIVRKKREADQVHPVRRSLRQRQLRENATHAQDSEAEALKELEPLSPRPKRVKIDPLRSLNLPSTELWTPNKGKKLHLSSSQLEIQLEEFHERCLGTQLLPIGKQTVMQGLCPPGFLVKFSKMSGVQPWKNAVALFVNIESDSRYDNVFHHVEAVDGRRAVHFQWFGQHRWHDGSPCVTRLRGMKKGDESLRFNESYYDRNENERGREEPLLLFLRHIQGPYIYCGRLGYLGHRPASKPLEFRWQLLDVDSMQWEKVRGLLYSSETESNMAKEEK